MARVARMNFQTSFFHVITQGINKEYIFNKKEYIEEYIRLIKQFKREYNVSVLAYCIMNNHAHLLLYVKKIDEMTKFMHKIDGLYAQYYNKAEHRVGIVFRNRYVSEPIYTEEYLAKCIKYIHMNPVKAKIVNKCEDYKYSTFKEYYNGSIDEFQILINIFGKNYLDLFNNVEEDVLFKDIDINRDEFMNFGINKFLLLRNMSLDEVLETRNNKKELVKFLKNEYKIRYSEMMKRLNISKGEMQGLKR